MKKYTEKEFFTQNQHFTFRLRNLYLENKVQFYQLVDYLPSPIYINKKESLDYIYFSDLFFSYGKEIENLFEFGGKYLSCISEPFLLEKAKKKAQVFQKTNDLSAICNYLQCVSLNNKMTHYFTNKSLIDDEITLNTTLFPDQTNSLSKLFHSIIPDNKNCFLFWQQFQSLTKQEKTILKLVTKGYNSKQIGEQLFISKHTVITHRKNIYTKLDASSLADLIRFSMVLEIL
ncbi:helix-turn-helix transcriptional regulator [Polaribacter septentrionalilitoris]|uniref:helix-turn-helix transcriptional regulator n=1 Tax=Polaribacter septentrionalilitoris TaxID=2494657 RepID=UPI001357EBCE|nr:LuxR family transcriptional regulator [Polaribacter septentrionalilitoris]